MRSPLMVGHLGAGFAALFNDTARQQVGVGSPDHLAVTDDGSALHATKMHGVITLHAIADPTGKVVAIAAALSATATGGSAHTSRAGELLLVPHAKSWLIGGYDLTVVRDPGNGAAPTTTTAKATP